MKACRFYDDLTPFYHLIFHDWDESVRKQAGDLDKVIKDKWGQGVNEILDVSCGIGTQAIGLANLGYNLIASDISAQAVERAKTEARRWDVNIDFSVSDMSKAFSHHQRQFDLIISCDNSIPHLLTDGGILAAFQQFFLCARDSGGCIISVRDYEKEITEGTIVKPYGVRESGGARYILFQVWDFNSSIYDMSFYIVEDPGDSPCKTQVMKTKYYAVKIGTLVCLMEQAGFSGVERIDDAFYQTIIVGKKI